MFPESKILHLSQYLKSLTTVGFAWPASLKNIRMTHSE